ncbi:MAG TPA: carboxypeptidase regulatory-like domain-containing protein [Vicinamibacterales bacterium]|nr:carboxypeptidase regulatory-like domain-containing protein [Vicinamibacterales bacterium]
MSVAARHSVLGWLVVAVAVCTATAHARQLPAKASVAAGLRVSVRDMQGLAIPGATCSLAIRPDDVVATAVTDAEGVVIFNGMSADRYELRVTIEGFEPSVRHDIVVARSVPQEIDVVLALARLSDIVTVTRATAIDTDVAAGASRPTIELQRSTLQRLPLAVTNIRDALPLVPGVLRSTTGELSFKGMPEQHSGLIVNGMNAADPATGDFRVKLPVDSVEAVQVFLHSYTAEYGQFTGGITTVETRAGDDRWHFELNDFLPDLRFVRGKVVGIAEDAPHLNISGPLLRDRVYWSHSTDYTIAKRPVRGLEFPGNETKTESQSHLMQFDFTLQPRHSQRVTVGYFPERNDYVGLDVFRRRPVTPSMKQRDEVVTIRDNSQLGDGLLSTAVSFSRFRTAVRGQGTEELTITPTVERGSYFASQGRASRRLELFAVYTLPTKHWLRGSHDTKFGIDVNDSSSRLHYQARPVNVVRSNGTRAERIEFDAPSSIRAGNGEYVGFLQDRWAVRPNLSFDLGVRYEDHQIADAQILAPRGGFAWSPVANGRTVIRGGIGVFYGKVPRNLRSFAEFPARLVTRFAPDGVTVVDQRRFTNILVSAGAPASFQPERRDPDSEVAFVPENVSWNLQVDRTFQPWLALRANVMSGTTSNIYIVNPLTNPAGQSAIVLSSTGDSTYRALELAARIGQTTHAINASYTRSRSRGDLNDFNASFGDFASPLVRPNQFSLLPSDVPNRFLAWGTLALPRQMTVAPIMEMRSGLPFSVRNAAQDFVGIRNADRTRFPWFFAIDMEAAKVFRVAQKYAIRPSIRGFNVTNHFNPRNVHANVDDPAFGRFRASYRRYFAGGFDVVF